MEQSETTDGAASIPAGDGMHEDMSAKAGKDLAAPTDKKTAGQGKGRRKGRRRGGKAANQAGPGAPRANGQEGRRPPVYAALDLGTNNCRLLVARTAPGGFRVIDAFSRIVRLGEGVASNGRLNDHAMDRSIEALKVCADKMRRRGVTRQRAIATQACRGADNGEEFIERVAEETGIRLDIVSTADEARLAVTGCAPLLDYGCESALVFDIGGGSTELMWLELDGARRKPRLVDWTSLPCGVVSLAERHGGELVTPEVFEAMCAEVREMLLPFEERHHAERERRGKDFHLLGTSGTVTTIAGVHLDLPRYDRNRVDGCWIRADDVTSVTQSLRDMGFDRRAAHPCVGRERADLVLAGCAILEAIRAAWPCDRLRVADRGLREGILLNLIGRDAARRRRRRRRNRGSSKATGAS